MRRRLAKAGNLAIDFWDWAFRSSGFGWREWRSLSAAERAGGAPYYFDERTGG